MRAGASLIVTSQEQFSELDILNLDVVHVREPSTEMKSRIARVSQDDHASEKVGELLALAKNGLEARIVGKVLRNIGVGISRYGLFDAYMRERLADSA